VVRKAEMTDWMDWDLAHSAAVPFHRHPPLEPADASIAGVVEPPADPAAPLEPAAPPADRRPVAPAAAPSALRPIDPTRWHRAMDERRAIKALLRP
jgi:hypothetical protein